MFVNLELHAIRRMFHEYLLETSRYLFFGELPRHHVLSFRWSGRSFKIFVGSQQWPPLSVFDYELKPRFFLRYEIFDDTIRLQEEE